MKKTTGTSIIKDAARGRAAGHYGPRRPAAAGRRAGAAGFLLALCLIAALAAGALPSCGPAETPDTTGGTGDTYPVTDAPPEPDPHVCAFGEWKQTEPASCTEDGLEIRSCVCGKTEERAVPAAHRYYVSEHWPSVSSAGFTRHLCAACGNVFEDGEKAPLPPSAGLSFMKDPYGDGAVLTGRGTCTDSEIAVPAEADGLPVTGVWLRAFLDDTELTAVYLPDGVTGIGAMAFDGCASLRRVRLPDTLESIGEYAFYGCSLLEGAAMPDSLKTVGASAFAMCSSLSVVEIGGGVTFIGTEAFCCCSGLEALFFRGSPAEFEAVDKQAGWDRLARIGDTVFLGS